MAPSRYQAFTHKIDIDLLTAGGTRKKKRNLWCSSWDVWHKQLATSPTTFIVREQIGANIETDFGWNDVVCVLVVA